jgi:hypothetical protein
MTYSHIFMLLALTIGVLNRVSPMGYFTYRESNLYAENVAVREIATARVTLCYI